MKNSDLKRPIVLFRANGFSSYEHEDAFLKSLETYEKLGNLQCLIALPYSLLKANSHNPAFKDITFGSNSVESIQEKSFTASIATKVLNQAGAKFAVVGSAERRQIFHEDDASINQKIKKLLAANIIPLLFVGETFKEHEENRSNEVITDQINHALKDVTDAQFDRVIIVYEAPWLSKSAKKFTPQEWLTICNERQTLVKSTLTDEAASKLKIIFALPEDMDDLETLTDKLDCAGYFSDYSDRAQTLMDSCAGASQDLFKVNFASLGNSNAPLNPAETHYVLRNHVADEKHPSEADQKKTFEDFLDDELAPQPRLEAKISQDSIPEAPSPKTDDKIAIEEEIQTFQEDELLDNPSREELFETHSEERLVDDALEIDAPEEENANYSEEIKSDTHSETGPDQTASPPLADEETPVKPKRGRPKKQPTDVVEPASQETNTEIQEDKESTDLPSHNPPSDSHSSDFAADAPKEEPHSMQRFQDMLSDLDAKKTVLSKSYKSLTTQAERLKKLRTDYPTILEKLNSAIEKLPPDLQIPLKKGDLDFFKQNPAEYDRARPAFELIQIVNELVVEAAAIPRQIDRLQPKARQEREALQEAWDLLQANRLAYKKAHPELEWPQQPEILASPPPNIDLSFPVQDGPSPLKGKRIGVFKAEKKPS